uniref:Uncharacterized protein n=1 Tax=Romanomermis culicivorax TaxID=13658 RepID=A0A915LB58_ROMCU
MLKDSRFPGQTIIGFDTKKVTQKYVNLVAIWNVNGVHRENQTVDLTKEIKHRVMSSYGHYYDVAKIP